MLFVVNLFCPVLFHATLIFYSSPSYSSLLHPILGPIRSFFFELVLCYFISSKRLRSIPVCPFQVNSVLWTLIILIRTYLILAYSSLIFNLLCSNLFHFLRSIPLVLFKSCLLFSTAESSLCYPDLICFRLFKHLVYCTLLYAHPFHVYQTICSHCFHSALIFPF